MTAGMMAFVATSEIIREIKYQRAETRRLVDMAEKNTPMIDDYLAHAKKVLRANVVTIDSHLPQIYEAEGLGRDVLDKLSDLRRRLLKADPQSASDRLAVLQDLVDFKEIIGDVSSDIRHLRYPVKANGSETAAESPFKEVADRFEEKLYRPFFHLTFIKWCLKERMETMCKLSPIWNP